MQQFKYNPKHNSGQFRHRITILKETSVKDELGQDVKDELGQIEKEWVEIKKAWSTIKTTKGSEYVAAGAERSSIVVRFILYYTTGINADMRISYEGRIFDIIEPPINDDEMNKTLTIIAKERG
jgi:SPP1 family predicted phage head-tail adaptor